MRKISKIKVLVAVLIGLLFLQIIGMSTPLLAVQEPQDLFADTIFQGDPQRFLVPTIIRTRFVTVDFNLLPAETDKKADLGNTLELNLFGGVYYRAMLQRLEIDDGGRFSWIGTIDGINYGQVILVYKDGIMSGNISLPDAFYEIRYISDGIHAIHEIDHSKFPSCALTDTEKINHQTLAMVTKEPVLDGVVADSGDTIDVLVVYDQAARAAAGGTSAMQTLITLAVTESNAGYSNSGVSQRIRLVHSAEVDYSETSFNWSATLDRLQGTADGYMDEVHTLRNTYVADEVVLLVNDTGYCGLAYLMTTVSTSFASDAFALVSLTCATGYYSFAHELGHNMGCHHDRANTGGGQGAYSYAYGYQAPDKAFRTIMAYNCATPGCTRVNYWSNPDKTYGGQPMGVLYSDPLAADNRRALNNTASTVANFRVSGSTPTPTITVTSPNGGESWAVGSTQYITWSTSGTVGDVKIEYTTNNGSNWTTAINTTGNDGSYSWTVPNAASATCKVRISEAADSSPTDSSNAAFTITTSSSPTITVTSPNGGENWLTSSTHNITWSTTGSVGNIKIEYSINNSSSWTPIIAATANDGSHSWTLPSTTSTTCKVRVSEASDGSPVDSSNSVFTISSSSPTPSKIKLDRTQLYFGADTGGAKTSTQTVLIGNSGGGTLTWSASSNASWLHVSPASGTQSGILSVSVVPTVLSAGMDVGTITVSANGATNSPQTITVNLTMINSGTTTQPFGEFSTPVNGTIAMGSIPVTGWVLDDIEVVSVKIYNGAAYIGDAVFVEGARPDVEGAYPGFPKNYQAGWGYMLLTNFLPGGGNGEYTLYAIATDAEGHQLSLGFKTITVANSSAVKPFGAIDTPLQGGSASGSSFLNWGWVLTPQPNSIATNGSTIDVWVDGVNLGHPIYNLYRSDIATLFPGYANSNGAVGYRTLNTTTYANGIHTIQWTAKDTAGNTDGIGSRYFSIYNASSRHAETSATLDFSASHRELQKDTTVAIGLLRGYREDVEPQEILPASDGVFALEIKEDERVEIRLRSQGPVEAISPLPVGSTVDRDKGIFYWQPGPGFLGKYTLMFARQGADGQPQKVSVVINIVPKF